MMGRAQCCGVPQVINSLNYELSAMLFLGNVDYHKQKWHSGG
jgi:nickel-dependent lactate racemase